MRPEDEHGPLWDVVMCLVMEGHHIYDLKQTLVKAAQTIQREHLSNAIDRFNVLLPGIRSCPFSWSLVGENSSENDLTLHLLLQGDGTHVHGREVLLVVHAGQPLHAYIPGGGGAGSFYGTPKEIVEALTMWTLANEPRIDHPYRKLTARALG